MDVEKGLREDSGKVPETPRSNARRRLLRAGLAGAPVVMTDASRPVQGAVACTTASAGGSANSAAAQTVQMCSGLTPEQWKAQATNWPAPYTGNNPFSFQSVSALGFTPPPGTLYHCPTTGFSGHVFGDRTMLEVLDIGEGGGGLRGLGRYMVAALLNACCGRTPVLTETAVRGMWNDMVNRGYYEPTAGVQWQAPEIIAYLRTTMG
jgi:hypothetical protein